MKGLEKSMSFNELGLSEKTLQALEKRGFTKPTPIQEKIIPIILKEKVNVVGQAQTGTGKTAAFGIPLLEEIKEKSSGVQVLILVPTRELALQVSEEINSLKGDRRLQVVPIYGGQSIVQQLGWLKKGVDIVVGTPGRILDHINRKSLKLGKVTHLVLDEADEMLNMGFIDDVEEILKSTNEEKRVMLFSATMAPRILNLAEKYMGVYKMVKVTREGLTAHLVEQIYFKVAPRDKFEALCRVIDWQDEFYGLVFCKTKIEVDEIAYQLAERGFGAEAIHGDISQNQREKILNKFKSRKIQLLVATDVAARGLDINNLTHVINYSLPQNPESYVHRIGRTGRSGKEGMAITFVTAEDQRKIIFIKNFIKSDIRHEKLPKVEDLLKLKRIRLQKNLVKILESHPGTEYLSAAENILADRDAKTVMASLLHYLFEDELNAKSYKEIAEATPITLSKRSYSPQSAGSSKGAGTRLFVAQGKVNGLTHRKLIDLIKQQATIHEGKIMDIQIFDKFSFLTVPAIDAQMILKAHHIHTKQNVGGRPVIEMAKN